MPLGVADLAPLFEESRIHILLCAGPLLACPQARLCRPKYPVHKV